MKSGPLRSNSRDIAASLQSAGGRSRYSHAIRRCSTNASLALWMLSRRSMAISLSMENWSYLIHRLDLHIIFYKIIYRSLLQFIFTCSIH